MLSPDLVDTPAMDARQSTVLLWAILCTQYGLTFTIEDPFIWPLSPNTQRALLKKILQVNEPSLALTLDLDGWDEPAVTNFLYAAISKHHMKVQSRAGRKSKIERRLRAQARINIERTKDGGNGYHWGGSEAAKRVLKADPTLAPREDLRRGESSRENALFKQYRKDKSDAECRERKRSRELEVRANRFWAELDDELRIRISDLIYLWKRIPDLCNGDDENRLLLVSRWKTMAVMALPEDTLGEFISIFMDHRQLRQYAGLALQVEANEKKVQERAQDKARKDRANTD